MAVMIEQETTGAFGRQAERRSHWYLVPCVAAAYIATRVAIAVWVGPHAHPDTTGYIDYPVSFTGSSPRPWVASILMRLGEYPFIAIQAAVSAVGFLVLGAAIAATLRDRRIQIATVILFALLGLSPRVTGWDGMLLTESLALGFTALLVACLIHIGRVPWWVTTIVFTLWLFTRDAHLYLAVMVLAGVVVWAVRARRWILPAALSVSLLWGAFAYSNDDTVEGMNVTINIAWYAGTDVDTFRWFLAHDMPLFNVWSIRDFNERWPALYNEPAFRHWAETDGQRVYAEYLATHPTFVLGAVRYLVETTPREYDTLLDHPHATFEIARTTGLPVWPDRGVEYTWLLLAASVLGALLAARAGRLDSRWILPGLLVGSAVPHAILAYHATPSEVARHGLVLAFTLIVAGWWMIALAADVLLVPILRTGGTEQIDDVGITQLAGEDGSDADSSRKEEARGGGPVTDVERSAGVGR